MLGYFLGPFSVLVMNSILNNYLNVYYTDIIDIGSIWGGWFLSLFPVVVKVIDALAFVLMGIIVDGTHSAQGKARPWILFSAPLLCVSLILLFVVPVHHEMLMAFWIFISYNLCYSIAYTAYNTAHTLMVPLSTKNIKERDSLSIITNGQGMLSGSLVAVLFPTIIVPAMGTNQSSWVLCMCIVGATAFPLILAEYYFTRERVTEQAAAIERNCAAGICLAAKSLPERTVPSLSEEQKLDCTDGLSDATADYQLPAQRLCFLLLQLGTRHLQRWNHTILIFCGRQRSFRIGTLPGRPHLPEAGAQTCHAGRFPALDIGRIITSLSSLL